MSETPHPPDNDEPDEQLLEKYSWQECEYCGAALIEIDPYVYAKCSQCGSMHAWDSTADSWTGL